MLQIIDAEAWRPIFSAATIVMRVLPAREYEDDRREDEDESGTNQDEKELVESHSSSLPK